MTVTFDLYAGLRALLAAHAPDGVQVAAVDPGKWKTAARGSIWVAEIDATSEFRSLGATAAVTHGRRREDGTIRLNTLCYRESSSHFDAAAEAMAKIGEIAAGVEAMVEADDSLSLGGLVSWARVARIKVQSIAADGGWVAAADIDLEFKHRP